MDETDKELIALLRQNARMNVADLAHKLKVSRGTVTNHLRKLEDTGVIHGYTVRLRPDVVSEPDQREANQKSAPAVERGLFLVPKVIE